MMKVALTLQIILVYGLMILSSPLLVLWSLIKSVFLTKKRSFNGKVILVRHFLVQLIMPSLFLINFIFVELENRSEIFKTKQNTYN